MKYKIKQSGRTQKIIEMHISGELISKELDRIYREISKNASLPGFRTGKAPVELIKTKYKKEARDEAVKNLIANSFDKVIKESNMEMLGLPGISDLQFDEAKGMSYKATVNIRPEVKLKSYKGLSLKKAKKEIKESDVDSEINALRESNAKFLTKEKVASDGDYIICDADCAVEGAPLEKKKNVWLYVGEGSFIPGKELQGLKSGDERDVEKTLPKSYSKKEVAGKKANFHIKVKEVKEKILPELNDEFAATLGNFKNMTELRETARKTMKKRNEIEERRDLENQSLSLLDKMAVFDAPQFMVDKQLEMLVNQTKEKLKRDQVSDEEIKSMEKDFRERLKKEATRQVRAYFILDKIAELENIKVDDKEIEDAFGIMASSAGRSADDVRKYYKEHNLIEDLKEDIRQRKILDFIIQNAKIN
jgi:trigger factor